MARRLVIVLIAVIGVQRLRRRSNSRRNRPPPREAPRATAAGPGQSPLPPLSEDAQRLIDQLKQTQDSIVEQLRFLQSTYRDAGRAEDAAAIAARVRVLQQRVPPVTGTATADLVNEGLPPRDAPVTMSMFRAQAGETLSFAIRGRDDLPVWGTTTYTDDSPLEVAAVHAGLLRPGQSGIVKVRPLPGQDHYEASSQNGVQSLAYGQQRGSYRFGAVSIATRARSSSLSSYRDLVGHSVTSAGRRHGHRQRLGIRCLYRRLLARRGRGARRCARCRRLRVPQGHAHARPGPLRRFAPLRRVEWIVRII